jgi:hypothetical protein
VVDRLQSGGILTSPLTVNANRATRRSR